MTVDQEEGLCLDDYVWDEDVRRFECHVPPHNKFYEVWIEERGDAQANLDMYVVHRKYGRIGTTGQYKTNIFYNESAAKTEVRELVEKRLAHGYVEV